VFDNLRSGNINYIPIDVVRPRAILIPYRQPPLGPSSRSLYISYSCSIIHAIVSTIAATNDDRKRAARHDNYTTHSQVALIHQPSISLSGHSCNSRARAICQHGSPTRSSAHCAPANPAPQIPGGRGRRQATSREDALQISSRDSEKHMDSTSRLDHR
jgi:hypothetical protein